MSRDRHDNTARLEFGAYLRGERERRELSLADVARITKIPERSLVRLEEGAFEALPAEVFIRGFLRSYARCVGIDAEDTVQRYRDAARPARATTNRPTDASGSARAPQAGDPGKSVTPPGAKVAAASGARSGVASESRVVVEEASATPAAEGRASWSEVTGAFIARSLFDRPDGDEEHTRRGTVTLAVIILVILATLTTSYWLRRPSSSGTGVTDATEFVGEQRGAARA